MDHGTIPAPALIAVNAGHMRELTHRYVEYRQALTPPGDPVKALNLTGDVLAAVRQVITGTGPATGAFTATTRAGEPGVIDAPLLFLAGTLTLHLLAVAAVSVLGCGVFTAIAVGHGIAGALARHRTAPEGERAPDAPRQDPGPRLLEERAGHGVLAENPTVPPDMSDDAPHTGPAGRRAEVQAGRHYGKVTTFRVPPVQPLIRRPTLRHRKPQPTT